MFQIVCMGISVTLFVLGIVCFFLMLRGRKHRGGGMGAASPLSVLMCGTAGALFSIYLVGNIGAAGGWIDTVFTALLGTVRAMTGENSLFDTREVLGTIPANWEAAIAIYTAFLHVTSAALLLGIILSLVKNFFPKLRYRIQSIPAKHLCVFSTLSERSLLLAEDIRRQDPSALLVFLGRREDSEEYAGFVTRADEIDGFLFEKDVCDLRVYGGCRKKRTDYFLFSLDEKDNMRDALQLASAFQNECRPLLRKYEAHCEALDQASIQRAAMGSGFVDDTAEKQALWQACADDVREVRIHVTSTQTEAEALLDAVERPFGKLSLRLINETRLILWRLFDQIPLFLGAKEDRLAILVIGAGRTGTEAVKLACWCGQTLKLRPEIIVVDNDPAAEERFARACPELAAKTAPAQAREDSPVTFFHMDVESADFPELLRSHPEIGYVICALGDEELNLRTAMGIRSVFEELSPTNPEGRRLPPWINVLVSDPFLHEAGKKLQFDARVDCNLETFGNLREVYTCETMADSYMERVGYQIHRFYERRFSQDKPEEAIRESFEEKEYTRSSSMAAALHCKYKLYAALWEAPEILKAQWIDSEIRAYDSCWRDHPEEAMLELLTIWLEDPANLEALAEMEHRRWNAYMRAEGWKVASEEQVAAWFPILKKQKNLAARLHPCMVSWEELDRVSRWLEETHGYRDDFKETDRALVRNIPQILRAAAKA